MRTVLIGIAVAAALVTPARATGPGDIEINLSTDQGCRDADLCVDYPLICSHGTCYEVPEDLCFIESTTQVHECVPTGDGFPWDLVPWDDVDPHRS